MGTTRFRLPFLCLAALGTPAVLVSQSAPAAGPADAREARGSIRQMQRFDRDRGLVLTDGALLFTDDGGATWADLSPRRGLEGVSEAFFLEADRGWLAGVTPGAPSRLVVLDTADGGSSWREQSIETSDLSGGRFYAGAQVHFADADHGWLLGRVATGAAVSVGELLATADAGESWQRLPQPPVAGRLMFVSAERGFMAGAPVSERLYRTLDGGRSWHELRFPIAVVPGRALYGLPAFTTSEDGTLAVTVGGERPRLVSFVTRDGGLSWQRARSRALPAGDYEEPVATTLTASGDAAALSLGASIELDTTGGRRALSVERPTARPTPDGAVPSVRALSVDEDGRGWALVAEGRCDAGSCRQTTRLVALDGSAGGAGADLLTRTDTQASSQTLAPSDAFSTTGLTISLDKGFDKCAAASVAQMQTWRTSSPYRDANIYHGGSARACSQPNLTASWVSAVFQQGWRLIPTWVGPQAPCTSFGRRFSLDPATARSQGLAEADAAVNAAAALGLGPSTPVYYDMEHFNATTACSTAVRAFVDAWTERVKARGYVAGMYGTASNTQAHWRPGLFAHVPDAVWVAAWACTGTTCNFTPSVFGIPGLSDAYWTNNQRIRQYWGGHNETWGGVTFNIDSNYANGPVASPDVTGGEPDLVVDSVSMSPASPSIGQAVTFTSVVRNAGTAPTPSGVVIGVGYRVDGTQVTWGSVSGPLAPGASVTIGTNGGSWSATSGSHVLVAVADDVNRIVESNEANNQRSHSFSVGGVAQFICDDGSSCLAFYGPSAYWHRATSCGSSALGYGGDMYWTYVNGSVVSNYARWTPALGGPGTYQLSVFVPRCNGTSQQARYRIVHNGVTDVRTVNQNVYYDVWVSLGSFSFAGTGGEYVELTDATGESYTTRRQLAFDAIRWVRQ
jgi:photosystem II stability/assembly factor-like uncharacterized protein